MFKVLLVDDTKSVHAFVRSILKPVAGLDITPAMNGAEALEILKSGQQFDLILLDWEMPVMDGPQTLAKLQEMDVSTPRIMMTTRNSPSDIQKMLEAGASEYVMKPFTLDILLEKINFVTGQDFNHAA